MLADINHIHRFETDMEENALEHRLYKVKTNFCK